MFDGRLSPVRPGFCFGKNPTGFSRSRIYVLSEGRCVEQGSHSELMARQGQYYAMASIQPFDLGKSGGSGRKTDQ